MFESFGRQHLVAPLLVTSITMIVLIILVLVGLWQISERWAAKTKLYSQQTPRGDWLLYLARHTAFMATQKLKGWLLAVFGIVRDILSSCGIAVIWVPRRLYGTCLSPDQFSNLPRSDEEKNSSQDRPLPADQGRQPSLDRDGPSNEDRAMTSGREPVDSHKHLTPNSSRWRRHSVSSLSPPLSRIIGDPHLHSATEPPQVFNDGKRHYDDEASHRILHSLSRSPSNTRLSPPRILLEQTDGAMKPPSPAD